jgi:hypothetical protein
MASLHSRFYGTEKLYLMEQIYCLPLSSHSICVYTIQSNLYSAVFVKSVQRREKDPFSLQSLSEVISVRHSKNFHPSSRENHLRRDGHSITALAFEKLIAEVKKASISQKITDTCCPTPLRCRKAIMKPCS